MAFKEKLVFTTNSVGGIPLHTFVKWTSMTNERTMNMANSSCTLPPEGKIDPSVGFSTFETENFGDEVSRDTDAFGHINTDEALDSTDMVTALATYIFVPQRRSTEIQQQQ